MKKTTSKPRPSRSVPAAPTQLQVLAAMRRQGETLGASVGTVLKTAFTNSPPGKFTANQDAWGKVIERFFLVGFYAGLAAARLGGAR